VIRRAALAPDAPDEALREAARRLGFDEAEVAALTGERGAREALALGRALARGRR
jgi:2-hydroxychromene-2-carboxylate isomerase